MTSLHPISSLPRQHAEHFLHRHHADRNKIGNPANALTLAWIYVSEKRQKCFYFITRLHLLTIPVIHVSSTSLFLCSMPFSIRYCTFWTRRVCTGNQQCRFPPDRSSLVLLAFLQFITVVSRVEAFTTLLIQRCTSGLESHRNKQKSLRGGADFTFVPAGLGGSVFISFIHSSSGSTLFQAGSWWFIYLFTYFLRNRTS